jgi:uncharacterized protein YegP (UPF0339 family)
MKPTLKVEIYKRWDGKYDWRAKAGNNEIVATSHLQGYENRQDAKDLTDQLFGGHYHVETAFTTLEDAERPASEAL